MERGQGAIVLADEACAELAGHDLVILGRPDDDTGSRLPSSKPCDEGEPIAHSAAFRRGNPDVDEVECEPREACSLRSLGAAPMYDAEAERRENGACSSGTGPAVFEEKGAFHGFRSLQPLLPGIPASMFGSTSHAHDHGPHATSSSFVIGGQSLSVTHVNPGLSFEQSMGLGGRAPPSPPPPPAPLLDEDAVDTLLVATDPPDPLMLASTGSAPEL